MLARLIEGFMEDYNNLGHRVSGNIPVTVTMNVCVCIWVCVCYFCVLNVQ